MEKNKNLIDTLTKHNGDLEYQMQEIEVTFNNEKNNADKARYNAENQKKIISGELEFFKKQLEIKNEEIEDYADEVNELKKEIDKLVKEVKIKDQEVAKIEEKNKSLVESLNKKIDDLEYQLLEIEQKYSFEKSSIEKSKQTSESQASLAAQETQTLQFQLKAYAEEISRINDLRTKELKEKNSEIQDLKQKLAAKLDEINQIETELQKINLEHKEDTENSEGGAKSLWKFIDQLNKQIEDKNSM